jgi:toxin ParE1/3/4
MRNMGTVDRHLVWSPQAERDLLDIWQFGAIEWSPAVADKHNRTLWRACQRLTENSQLGRSRQELMNGVHSIAVVPHVVFYRSSSSAIEIIRVLHQSEDVETIFHS